VSSIDRGRPLPSMTLGMLLFVVSEVMFFG
jgi:heme/copper-type cytochrome/quinol oxidase subunit 3